MKKETHENGCVDEDEDDDESEEDHRNDGQNMEWDEDDCVNC